MRPRQRRRARQRREPPPFAVAYPGSRSFRPRLLCHVLISPSGRWGLGVLRHLEHSSRIVLDGAKADLLRMRGLPLTRKARILTSSIAAATLGRKISSLTAVVSTNSMPTSCHCGQALKLPIAGRYNRESSRSRRNVIICSSRWRRFGRAGARARAGVSGSALNEGSGMAMDKIGQDRNWYGEKPGCVGETARNRGSPTTRGSSTPARRPACTAAPVRPATPPPRRASPL